MSEEGFVLLRSPSEPKRRVRAMFVCPSCGWKLQAVLEQELTTVRCECDAQFAVRKPAAKPKNRYGQTVRPPLRSILQGGRSSQAGSSDTDSHASIPSHSSIQSVMVSHCSSASSAVVSISAPSAHSLADSPKSERRASTEAGPSENPKELRATRVALPKSLPEEESRQKPQEENRSKSAQSASNRQQGAAGPSSSTEGSMLGEGVCSAFEGLGSPRGGWLGQIFSTASITS